MLKEFTKCDPSHNLYNSLIKQNCTVELWDRIYFAHKILGNLLSISGGKKGLRTFSGCLDPIKASKHQKERIHNHMVSGTKTTN